MEINNCCGTTCDKAGVQREIDDLKHDLKASLSVLETIVEEIPSLKPVLKVLQITMRGNKQ